MTGPDAPYPVRVDAVLDAPVSRWLWLVKWVLLVPHAVLLAFLWVAFLVVSVIAFGAILVTGRYPRPLFDFNVGVLRWTWRVQYYGYAALGTDRYPPFTLADVPDYPARLHVEYPDRLSRGLVLVKWWLLALPHYVVVAAFAGGGLWFGTNSGGDDRWDDGWAFGGLVGLLVFVVGVVLLFRGQYPRSVYDFVLGMDRWVLRVAGYAALMTDRYPPFRLDMGGTDPASPAPGPTHPAPAGAGAVGSPGGPPTQSRWTGGRVVALVTGALLTLTSTGLLLGGAALLWADQTQREDGWLTSTTITADTGRHALVSEDLTLDTGGTEWLVDEVLGRVRLEVTPLGGDPVFVGVAPSAAVDGHLAGVGRTVVDDLSAGQDDRNWGWGWGWGTAAARLDPGMTTDRPGGPPARAPGELDIWTASTQGNGTQLLEWAPTDGDWTVVVMPTDRSAGIAVEVAVAATVPGLGWLAGGLLAGGGVLLACGVLLIVLAVRRAAAGAAPPTTGEATVPPGDGPTGTQAAGSWSPSTPSPGLSPSGRPR